MARRLPIFGALLGGGVVVGVSLFVWFETGLSISERAGLITAICTGGLVAVASFGVIPALYQSIAASEAAEASRAGIDLEVVSKLVYGSWMKSQIGLADGVALFGQRVTDDRSARRTAMADLRGRVAAAKAEDRDGVRSAWWTSWAAEARYVGSRQEYAPANQVAVSLADELEVLGLACMAGLAPLPMILAGNANNAVTDWALCQPWVDSYRKAVDFSRVILVDEVAERVDWQRRHAEWFAMVAFLWMKKAYPDFDLLGTSGPDAIVQLTPDDARRRIRAITKLDEETVVPSTRRQLDRLLRPSSYEVGK